jgi:hypothetical protein
MSFPNPGFQQPQQQGYPAPAAQPAFPQQAQQQQPQYAPQQQAPMPQPITQNVDDWFAQNQGGGGAPSFKFSQDGDTVQGEVVHMEARQQTDMESGKPLFFDDGTPRMQLVVTLQTTLRGWQGVTTIPTDKDANGNDVPRDPSRDDGKRRIYVKSKMQHALMEALRATGSKKLNEGDNLAVRQIGTEPNPKVKNGQPVRLFAVVHQPGNPGANAFFAGAAAQQPAAPQPAPAPQPQYAPQPQAPAPAPAPQPQYAPPAPQPQAPQYQQPQGQQAPAPGQYPVDPPF